METVLAVLTLMSAVILVGLVLLILLVHRGIEEMRGVLARLVEGKRLSQALTMRLKDGIEFSPPEPNKEALKARVPQALDHWWFFVTDLDTKAHGVFKDVGVLEFVHHSKWHELKTGLKRYMVNEDYEGARQLLEVVIDQL